MYLRALFYQTFSRLASIFISLSQLFCYFDEKSPVSTFFRSEKTLQYKAISSLGVFYVFKRSRREKYLRRKKFTRSLFGAWDLAQNPRGKIPALRRKSRAKNSNRFRRERFGNHRHRRYDFFNQPAPRAPQPLRKNLSRSSRVFVRRGFSRQSRRRGVSRLGRNEPIHRSKRAVSRTLDHRLLGRRHFAERASLSARSTHTCPPRFPVYGQIRPDGYQARIKECNPQKRFDSPDFGTAAFSLGFTRTFKRRISQKVLTIPRTVR